MILSIPLEISVRELQGHLLLAVEAAARGHQTVVASTNDLWLYRRLGRLPAGPYLVKNVNMSRASATQYDTFVSEGFSVFAHEQEPSILWTSFEKFLQDYNITADQALPFAGVGCWGQRDTAEYRAFFPRSSEVFVETGSPRADLWTPRYRALRQDRRGDDPRPYVLLVSNFGFWMGRQHWSEWLERSRRNDLFPTRDLEEAMLSFLLEESALALHLVKAARHLAVRRPDLRVLVRPHPLDEPAHWRRAAGDIANLEVVDVVSPLSDWIAGAAAVLQNGCTSAVEAVLQGVPLLAYGPARQVGNLLVPSHLGLPVPDLAALEAAVAQCLHPGGYDEAQARSLDVLRPLVRTEGDAPARMVDLLESRTTSRDGGVGRNDIRALQAVRSAKGALDTGRVMVGRMARPSAAAVVRVSQVRRDVGVFASMAGVPAPQVTALSDTGVLIAPARSIA